MNVTAITKTIAIAGGLFSLAIVLIEGDHSSLLMIALGLAFGAWVIAPFALIYRRAPTFADSIAAGAIVLLAIIIATALSLFAYGTTFIDNPTPDAQDGLLFVFVPLYQLIGASLALFVASWVARWAR